MSFHKNLWLLFLSLCIGMLIACDKPSDSRKPQPNIQKPPESAPAPTPAPAPEPPKALEPKDPEAVKIPGEGDVSAEKLCLLRKVQTTPVRKDRNVRGFAPSTKRMDLGENEVFNLKIVISSDGKYQAELTKTRWCEFVLFRPKCDRKVRTFSTGTWEYSQERIVLIDDQRFVVAEVDAEQKDSYIITTFIITTFDFVFRAVDRNVGDRCIGSRPLCK